jgi:glycosyltransferase involved in cell wall biosynthesis
MASDIFIFSSTAETQGMVLLEAMAASLPVVAVSSPGVNDIIQDGINGFKTSNDIKEWGEKLISLMENPNKLQKISLNALETAKRYTIGSIGKKAISIYKQLIRT